MSERVLVTGGCGFIGREVVRQLIEAGNEVTVLDDLSNEESRVEGGYRFVEGGVGDGSKVAEALRGQDRVIHLAAKNGGIAFFSEHPGLILSDSGLGYATLLTGAVRERIKRFVHVSSSMVYESATTFPTAEADTDVAPPPISAYARSKLAGEWFCRAFHDEFGLEFAVVRPYNVYGPVALPERDTGKSHVIPDFVRRIRDGQSPLRILGDGMQTRCFTHVCDIARGMISASVHPLAANETFNLAAARETSVRELAELIWGIMKKGEPCLIETTEGYAFDARRQLPDVSKAKELIGWEAKISLEDALPEVVACMTAKYA
jgi:UDP-glucose 4-epimerase